MKRSEVTKEELAHIESARNLMDGAHHQDDGPHCVWMPKEVFFLLGGTQEHWDMIPGDDSGKVVES